MDIFGSVVVGVVCLTAVVILLLIFVLLFAESKLVQKGNVKILINDDPEISSPEVPAGGTLCSACSAAQSVFLPSACGGGGTCAMCKCQVFEGGGDILPTELTHISRSEAKENWRSGLPGQGQGGHEDQGPGRGVRHQEVGVRGPSPTTTSRPSSRSSWSSCPRASASTSSPGGYIQIDVPKYKDLKYRDFDGRRRSTTPTGTSYNSLGQYVANNDEECFRAYSMANHPAEGNIVMLNIRIATPPPRTEGIPSGHLLELRVQPQARRQGAPSPAPTVSSSSRRPTRRWSTSVVVPAWRRCGAHIFHLFHTLKTGRKVSYWYGARSKREIFYEEHFRKIEEEFPNFKFHIALSEPLPEDNWDGYTGFIHQVLHDNYLSSTRRSTRSSSTSAARR